MGNADTKSSESKAPGKSSGRDEDPAERVRGFIGFATGVAGTVAAFLVGFGILPSASLLEQVLNLCTAIGLSGAIIAGIGAWRDNLRRFVIMWVFIGMAVVCLAALAVVAQRQAARQSAIGASHGQPTGPASNSLAARPSEVAAPATFGNASSPSRPGDSPANRNGQVPEFTGQSFSIPGNNCSDNNNYPSVHFTGQGPVVTANDENAGSFGPLVSAWDIDLDCFDNNIGFNRAVAILHGKPSLEACETQIRTNPLSDSYPFLQLTPGMQFCLDGTNGNNLVFVKLTSVSDASFTTEWMATAWSIPASG